MYKIKLKKLILFIGVAVLAVCCMAGCNKTTEPAATTAVQQEKDLFYFNIDKVVNPTIERQKDRVTGLYTFRFLKDGQIVELQTGRENIPEQIDNQKALVLTFDDDGYIKKFQSAQSAIGGQFYDSLTVTEVNGSVLTIDGRVASLTMADDASIYDLTGLTSEIGSYGQVQADDVICCYANKDGLVTQLYVIKRHPGHDDKHSCDHCSAAVEWISWDGTQALTSGHYCLAGDVALEETQLLSGIDVAICLNGYELTGKNRLFTLEENAALSIIDHAGAAGKYYGSMIGGGISVKGAEADDLVGGTIKVSNTSSLNIFGGNIGVKLPADKTSDVNRGGVVYSEGKVLLAGGVVTGGNVGYNGGAVYIGEKGSFEMSGGILQYGSAYKQEEISGSGRGGTIYIHKNAESASISGGKLIAGIVDGYGGGLYTEISMKITNAELCGDRIDGTAQAEYGGVMWVGGTESVVDIIEGTVFYSGSSVEGGNIAVRSTCTINVLEGAVIRDGYGSRHGGNAAAFGTLNINGGTIQNGYTEGTGGNIYCFTNGNTTLNVNSGLITGGSGAQGGNICMSGNLSYEKGSVLNVTGGQINNGIARTGNGGNIILRLHSVANITGGTITGGTAEKLGGGICTTYTSDSNTVTTLNVGGSAVISGNNGSDIYLVSKTDMNLIAEMPLAVEAKLGLAAEDITAPLINGAYIGCLDVFTWTPGDKTLVIKENKVYAE